MKSVFGEAKKMLERRKSHNETNAFKPQAMIFVDGTGECHKRLQNGQTRKIEIIAQEYTRWRCERELY